jgi:uncharacterized protein
MSTLDPHTPLVPPASSPAPAVPHPWRSLAQARKRVGVQAPVPSPCVGVCRMTPHVGWCEGCHRSIDELTRWSRMSDADKLQLWPVLEQRHAQLHPPCVP